MDWDEIEKARRRLSCEQGTIIKDWGGRIPIALIYPNTYYVGMSNLGIHAIYRLLNIRPEIVCERAFWEKESQSVLSLESQRPLSDFAVLAFSITYELDYFNVVQVLRASGIPSYAAERDERHPLVIAGGPCVIANLMPLSPFFDALCIGEAEPILPPLLEVLFEGLGSRREELLTALASLPGVYVPQHSSGKVVRQWTKNLNEFPVGSAVVTKDTELGALYLIEVERGCNWQCCFCLVSNAFSPMRFRSLGVLLEQGREGLKYRKRVGLVGPNVSAHPQIEELAVKLREMGAALSVSSLRIKPLSEVLLRELAQSGAETITLAPEAGSERLRRLIKKGISDQDILEAISKAAEQKVRQVKLYFMLGLPSETDEDIEAIVKLAAQCKGILDKKRSGTRLTLNAAPFVPKAGTPFQREPMERIPILNRRLALLRDGLQPRGIKLKSESPAWSEVQAVLSRGDTKVADVLANIEESTLAGFRRAAEQCQLDVDFYAHQKWDENVELPWRLIS